MAESKLLLSDKALGLTLNRLAHDIALATDGQPNLVLVGIQTGGAFLANRIAILLENINGTTVPTGQLDVCLFRDDIDLRPIGEIHETNIPFDLDDTQVVLVDDVLFSGRTIRAALEALLMRGRPSRVQLAVLIDRAGHRELPIEPNFVGKRQETDDGQHIEVQLTEKGGKDEVFLINS